MSAPNNVKSFSAFNTLKRLKDNAQEQYCLYVLPELEFSGREDGERVVLLIREHVYILFLRLALILLGLIMLISVELWALNLMVTSLGVDMPLSVYAKLIIASGVGALFLALVEFLKWYYNLFLISTNRILDLDVYSIMSSSWTTAKLENIEDVEVKNKGFLAILFKVGDLYIQTASEIAKIELKRIPKPLEIQDIIMDFSEIRKNKVNGGKHGGGSIE